MTIFAAVLVLSLLTVSTVLVVRSVLRDGYGSRPGPRSHHGSGFGPVHLTRP